MRHTHPAQTLPRSSASTLDDARWAAFVARDPAFDGHFFASVKTTGIYCRPSCPARRAKREHVRFYETAADAEAAGFRPCKRCKPNQPSLFQQHAEKVAEACRLIETAEEEPKLDALARSVGLSPYHFHRIFKSALGVTPKAYAVANRNKRMRDALTRSASVTEAIYDAGFNSNGRFYAASGEVLGMTPSEFRSGAPERRDQIRNRRELSRPGSSRGERQGRLRHLLRRRPRWARERPQEVVSESAARLRRSRLRAADR